VHKFSILKTKSKRSKDTVENKREREPKSPSSYHRIWILKPTWQHLLP